MSRPREALGQVSGHDLGLDKPGPAWRSMVLQILVALETETKEESNASAVLTMEFKIYNTMTQQKEVFTPIVPGKVGMYLCGITPYALSHLGHARASVSFDLLTSLLISLLKKNRIMILLLIF